MSQFFGQFHPLLVHLPIGIWVVAYLFKYLSFKSKEGLFLKTLEILLLVVLLSSLFTSISGYLISLSGAYEADLTFNHKFSGIALSILSAVLYGLIRKNIYLRFQNVLWFCSIPLLFLTGHFGGSLTHGEDYLSFTNKVYHKPIITDAQEAFVYEDIIEPIFAEKCWACHSAKKQKGELRLDGEKWILAGGENGQVINSHNSKESDLYQRLILEESHDDHMPPSRKPQLSDEETKLIAWWIDEGVNFEKQTKDLIQTAEIQSILGQLENKTSNISAVDLPQKEIEPADQNTIEELQKARLSIVPVALNSNYLRVNLLGKTLPDSVWASIENIAQNIVYLNANGSHLSPSQWLNLSKFSNLRKLDVSQTNITDSTLIYLSNNHELIHLNLSQTKISEDGIMGLEPLKKLQNLYLFGTKVSKKNWSQIQNLFPSTKLDSGNYFVPTLESDTTVFSKEDLIISTK